MLNGDSFLIFTVMINLLYDNLDLDASILNAHKSNGVSAHKGIEHYLTNYSIPFRTVDISKPLDSERITLYPVEPQSVFNIMNPDKPGFMDTVSNKAIEHIKSTENKCFLLIWFPTEGFCMSLFDNMIPRYIDLIHTKYNIPRNKILFVYGDINIKNSAKFTKLYNFIPERNVFGLNIFEHVSVGDFSSQKRPSYQELLFRKESKRDRKKLFLFKNGVVRPHRMFLITALNKLGLLDKGYYSWINHTGIKLEEEDYKRVFWHYYEDEEERDSHIKEYKECIEAQTPIILDKLPTELSDRSNQITLDNSYIKDSYFTLVTETVVDNENFGIQFFSEKTYQPIHTLHPFILYSSSGSLEYLRNLGYATFPELFNEEYDKITNEAKRGRFIVNEIKRLNSLDRNKLNSITNSDYMIDKLTHNQNLVETQPARNGYYQLMNWFESIYLRN